MYNAFDAYGWWIVQVFISTKKPRIDFKFQAYPPHGSFKPGVVPHGAIMSIRGRMYSDGLGKTVGVLADCVMP